MIYIFAGLATLFAFLVYRIAKQIWFSYKCPDSQDLRLFWFGKLDENDEVYRNVVTHLGVCDKCRERLHQIQKGQPLEGQALEREDS